MAETIDSLQIEISSSSESASKGLESLKKTLENFKSAVRGGLGLNAAINQVNKLSGASAGNTANAVNALASGLSSLKNAANGLKVSASIANQLNKISDAARGADVASLQKVTDSLKPLAELSKSNLSSYTTQLAKIPDIVNSLDPYTLSEFSARMQQISSALAPLANQLDRVGNAFAKFPQKVRAANQATRAIPTANHTAMKSYNDFSSLLRDAANGVRTLSRMIAGWINESNEYIENLNLFNVALGEYASSARRYADQVADVMGIDPSEWMRNQGVFYTLADGFGVVGDRAYLMSRNLTQLGYDISSFFNIPIEESMQKLQSGISGEIEPLRRLGYDLSQARLKAIAASLGIMQSVSSMTQAEKAQLRYYAIMTQVTSAQGDMARTLNSPANQLRILSASATQAARALGNIFIPAMNAMLPIAIAVAKAVRAVAVSIASLFGYSLPSVDFSVTADAIGDVSDGMNNVASDADNAGGAAKKLKSILMGFDEINQLPDLSGGGGAGGGGGGGSLSGFDFELPEYDFLSNMVGSQVDAIYRKLEPFISFINDHITSILANLTAISGAFLSWKLAKNLIPDLSKGWKLLDSIKGIAATLATLTIMVGLVYTFDTEFAKTGKPGLLIADGLSTLLSSAIVGRVVQHAFGINALYGAALTLGISAVTTISVMSAHVKDSGELDGNAIALGITGVVKAALAGAAAGGAIGGVTGAVAGAAIGFTIAAVAEVAATINGINQNKINNRIKWGSVELEAEKVHSYAAGLFDFDVDAKINLISMSSDKVDEVSASLNASIASIQSTLNTIQLKTELDAGDYSKWQSEISTLVSSMNSYITENENFVQVSVSVAPTLNKAGVDISGDIVNALGIGSEITQTAISRAGEGLSALLMKGVQEGLTAQELATAHELSASLARIAAAARTGEAQGVALVTADTIISGLSEKSYQDVVNEVTAMQDELRASLTEAKKAEYSAIASQLEMYRQGIREGIYTEQEEAQVKESIRQLQNELASMDITGSVDAAMSSVLAPVAQKFLQAFPDIYGEAFSSLDLSSIYVGEFAQNWVDQLQNGMDFSEFQTAFDTKLEQALVSAVGADRAVELLNMAEMFGFTGWDILGTEVQTNFYNMMVAATSKEDVDALFTQLGYSIPGAVKEGMDSAGGMVVAPVADTAEFETALANAAATAGATGDAVEGIGTDFSGMSSTAKTELANVETAATNAADTIAAAGTQAETLGAKIVEIPTEKVIAISISNYTSIVRNLNNITDKISKLSSKTVNLKVKAGLTSGAKTFLKALARIDTSMTSLINAVLNASQFAGGGYPKSGELFIANEAGAEMVGRIGNRTAVANQDQIGDAIFQYMDAHSENSGMDEERLASAIVSAMRAAGLGTVNIDGRMIAQAINRESQRRGKPAI